MLDTAKGGKSLAAFRTENTKGSSRIIKMLPRGQAPTLRHGAPASGPREKGGWFVSMMQVGENHNTRPPGRGRGAKKSSGVVT